MSKNTQEKSLLPKLVLAVDLGGSVTKVFYYDNAGNLRVLAMEPLTADVTESEIKNHLQQVVGNPAPEDIAWVKVVDKLTEESNGEQPTADKTYRVKAVGRLAKYFGGSAELRKAKFELGLFKILAAMRFARRFAYRNNTAQAETAPKTYRSGVCVAALGRVPESPAVEGDASVIVLTTGSMAIASASIGGTRTSNQRERGWGCCEGSSWARTSRNGTPQC